jgi:hypothetical protein
MPAISRNYATKPGLWPMIFRELAMKRMGLLYLDDGKRGGAGGITTPRGVVLSGRTGLVMVLCGS